MFEAAWVTKIGRMKKKGKLLNMHLFLYIHPVNIIIKIIDAINETVGRAVSWLTLALVLAVCIEVFRRSVLGETSVAMVELHWHLFALIFLLGSGYALKHDRHVRVDLFYTNFSKQDKAWVNFFGSILLLIPWLLIMIYWSYFYALDSWMFREGSPDPGGLPARYLIKFAIPIGLSLLLLQAVSLMLQSWKDLKPTQND